MGKLVCGLESMHALQVDTHPVERVRHSLETVMAIATTQRSLLAMLRDGLAEGAVRQVSAQTRACRAGRSLGDGGEPGIVAARRAWLGPPCITSSHSSSLCSAARA